jgi:hypothetical protein
VSTTGRERIPLTFSANAFVYATLPVKLAEKVLEQLNRAGASKLVPSQPRTIQEEDVRVEKIYNEWLDTAAVLHEESQSMMGGHQVVFRGKKPVTMGYVTHDACAGRGDDIEHTPREFSVRRVELS